MRIISAATAVSFSLINALAVAGSFDGPFVQAGVGFAAAKTAISTHWPDTNVDGTPSDTDFVGQIAAGYSHSWDAFNLAANLYYIIGEQQAGSLHTSNLARGTTDYDSKLKNTWGLVLEPGYNLNDTTLIYAKLGYGQASGEGGELFEGVYYNYDATYDAFIFGAGIKHLFSQNLYGVAELMQSSYDSNTWSYPSGSVKLEPQSLIGVIGVGYRF